MGMLMRRHRLEHLMAQEADKAVREALQEAKLKAADDNAPAQEKTKKLPKKTEA
jgi:hypothetical protein